MAVHFWRVRKDGGISGPLEIYNFESGIMNFIKGIFNAVADPKLFFIIACGLLAVMLWKRADCRQRRRMRALGFWRSFHLRHLRPELPARRDQAGQRADCRPDLPALSSSSGARFGRRAQRPPDRGRRADRKPKSDRVWVWPDLVYLELISLILCSVVLIVWSIFLKRPARAAGESANTPNPSKAPW
jgi:hypothetical protein